MVQTLALAIQSSVLHTLSGLVKSLLYPDKAQEERFISLL